MIGFVLVAGLLWWMRAAEAERADLVRIDGSSTVFPVTEAVAEEFQKANRGTVRVTVGISGTGGGFKKFCRGETDVQDASRPILVEEMEACRKNGVRYFELPVAFDAITIVVSRQNTWVDAVTVDELKRIWEPSAQGRVTRWRQIRPSWPDEPLKLFGAGPDSGTFDYFTEAVVGTAKASRGDYTSSEDDNTLVQGVARDKQALGYIPLAYFEFSRDKLRAVAVDSGKGPVTPSRETVENGMYQPLSRPLFIYVNADSARRPGVKQFVEFYLTKASMLVPQANYVPLSPQDYRLALGHFLNGRLGTAFQGGRMAGIAVRELLRRDARL
jgi:phosphate transport system substrate-binding protein